MSNSSLLPRGDETQRLVGLAGKGDAQAVNDLLQRHRAALRRLIEVRLDRGIAQRVDASDIVQDVMIEAHRRMSDYLAGPPMPFHAWLRQIARDRMIDAHRRHRGAARRSIDREQVLSVEFADRSAVDLAGQLRDHRELTPATAATRHELRLRFADAIDKLDEHDREIVLMRHFEQLTNQEAAQALGLSEPAAGMRYLRAIRRLRALLDETPADASRSS